MKKLAHIYLYPWRLSVSDMRPHVWDRAGDRYHDMQPHMPKYISQNILQPKLRLKRLTQPFISEKLAVMK